MERLLCHALETQMKSSVSHEARRLVREPESKRISSKHMHSPLRMINVLGTVTKESTVMKDRSE